jgi:YesN/AraC family two-component response regulator
MKSTQEWYQEQVEQFSQSTPHQSQEKEMTFYRAVASGSLELVNADLERGSFANLKGAGTLSDNPLTNLKYHCIIAISMIARFCSEGGMGPEIAYQLSDFYIRKVDTCQSEDEVIELHRRMCLDYTKRMMRQKRNVSSNKQVSDALNYIYAHIRERITVEDIALSIGISPTYLSRIFKQEMKVSVSEFIRDEKIQVAKDLLQFSTYSLVDIANFLSYSSQSHFIQKFHAQTGMTPKAFRDKYYMNNWDVNREDVPN